MTSPPISPLVADIITANLTATQRTTNYLFDNLTDERDTARATLAAVRHRVERLMSGPYMPTPAAVLDALYPDAETIAAHRAVTE